MSDDWLTATDPWLPHALRVSTELDRLEGDALEAVAAAMRDFLALARQNVLGDVAAAAQPLPPNVEAYPTAEQWTAILAAYTAEPLGTAFGTAFLATAATAQVAVEPFREAFVTTVSDRLSRNLWADGVFEEIRYELQEAHQAGEDVSQIRDRIGAVLHIDAYSREIRARINAYKRDGEPVPSSLYEGLRAEDHMWHWMARRIARTETLMAYNSGAFEAGQAWQDATGQTGYKLWLATTDARTRASHWLAHGQVQPYAEPFLVGGEHLDHPGDPEGSAAQTIQCRCTLLTLAADEAEQAQTRYEQELPNRTDKDGRPLVADADTDETAVWWRGPLAALDALSGDGRMIGRPSGEPRVVDHPKLGYQHASAPGHDGKINAGDIRSWWVADADLDGSPQPHLWAAGTFDMNDPDVPEVVRKMRDGYAGSVSVDLDDVTMEGRWINATGELVDDPSEDEFERFIDGEDIGKTPVEYAPDWRLGGVTLVQDPAFHTGHITVVDEWAAEDPEDAEPEGEVVAAACGSTSLPLAEAGTSWNGPAAASKLAAEGKLSAGHFWRDPEGDDTAQSSYKLPFATVVDGEAKAVPAGVHAAAAAVQGSRGGVNLPEGDVPGVKSKIAAYYRKMDETPPWDEEDSRESANAARGNVVTATAGTWAASVADSVPAEPPAAWFADPELTGHTKIRVTDQGRVYGHIAEWGSEHAAIPGQGVPRCPEGGTYPRFHRHGVRCADGTRVQTGPLATSGHPDTDRSISSAMAHYDDPNYVIADVVVGEDAHGIWASGALRPGVSALQVLAADRYSFSGDWRQGGYLVAACSVSVPGFHLNDRAEVEALAASADQGRITLADARPRSKVDSDGYVHALVASGIVRDRPARNAGSGRENANLGPWEFYREMRRAKHAHRQVDAQRRRLYQPKVDALAARIHEGR